MLEAKEELNAFGKYVIKQSRRRLTQGKSTTNDTKKLYNSLDFDVKVSKNSFSMSFYMENYGKYRDQGVKGKKSNPYNVKSPFKFGTGTGTKGGLTKAIEQWVARKGFLFRDRKTGRILSRKSTSFLITRSIYNKGIKPSLFFTKPFEDSFKRLPDELIEKYALDVEKFLKLTVNNGSTDNI